MIIFPKIFNNTNTEIAKPKETLNAKNISYGSNSCKNNISSCYYPLINSNKIGFKGNGLNLEYVYPDIANKAEGRVIVAKDKDDLLYKISSVKTREPIIAVVDNCEDIQRANYIPYSIKGVITNGGYSNSQYASHFQLTLKQRKVLCLDIPFEEYLMKYKDLLPQFDNKLVRLEESENGTNISVIDKLTKSLDAPEKIFIPKLKPLTEPILSKDYELDTVGLKAYNLKLLEERKIKDAQIPPSITIPCGMFDKVLNAKENTEIKQEYEKEISRLHNLSYKETEKTLIEIRSLISCLKMPEDCEKSIMDSVHENVGDGFKAVRSAFNGEDIKGFCAAGLYDSFYSKDEEVIRSIKEVWASKWNEGAYWTRCEHGIPHDSVQPTVIIQKLVNPDYSFVIDSSKDKLELKMARGLGEALTKDPLAHGQEIPYIFEYDKKTEEFSLLKESNRNRVILLKNNKIITKNNRFYSADDEKIDILKYNCEPLLKKVVDVALDVEKKWGSLQNIEGCVTENKNSFNNNYNIHLVQTRDMNS